MKSKYLFPFIFLLLPFFSFAQTTKVQNAAIPKDAAVDVTITDYKKNVLNNEIIVFKSQKNTKEYEGLSDDNGKFSIRLPVGDKYEIFVLGFKDSTSLLFLDIPAPVGDAYYKKPFIVALQHQPAKTFVLDNCNFDFGKATLQESSYQVLDELVSYLTRKDDEHIEIGGHTDNVGKAASNLKLSLDRANAVRDYLLAKGISADRVTAKGYGMTEPIAENTTEDGRAQNRRTEVKIL